MEEGSVRFGTSTIDFEVRRSVRRTKTVQITVDGERVRVLAPVDISEIEIRKIVRSRASWILDNRQAAAQRGPAKRFVSGESLPYLGRNVTMVVEEADTGPPRIQFDHWRFRVTVPPNMADRERYETIRDLVTGWYRRRAADRLPEAVARWKPRLGINRECHVLVRDQRRRWGSCAPDGTLRFNWRVMMLKPPLLEYVVVHELAHLAHPDHSRAFWALVNNAIPDAPRRRRDLKEAGRHLSLGG